MKYDITFLPDAEQDIDDILEYLSQFDVCTALNFYGTLKDRILTPEEMPYKYQTYEDDPYFHKMVVDGYLLFYSIDDKRKKVIVHRVFHSLRDTYQQIIGSRATD